jgi:hypothetical protein
VVRPWLTRQTLPGPQTIHTHTKFVQDVRYAPSGDHFASVGSDGKVFLYDGKAGETLGEFSEGHSGTAVSQVRHAPSLLSLLKHARCGDSMRSAGAPIARLYRLALPMEPSSCVRLVLHALTAAADSGQMTSRGRRNPQGDHDVHTRHGTRTPASR